jgi:UDP-N-acetyl-2-amino-2-deoxyglucuronate dehydrogenase
MPPLRTALVGTGKVAHLHAAALRDLPESQFVAVCGRPSDRRSAFAAQYAVREFDEVGAMVAAMGVDALCVCTPHPAHRDATVAAAEAGVHVLIEKPLAAALPDCDAMIAAGRRGGATLGMVSQRRFYPPCQRIRRAIDAGALGRPIMGTAVMFGWRDEAYYRSDPWRGSWKGEGGGVLVNQAVHQLDLLLWYLGEAESVFGYWGNQNHPYIEVEDTAVAVIRFRSGALGNVVVSNSQNPALHARVSVHGSNGASVGVQTDGGAMFIAGTTTAIEPPYNDLWTIAGETAQREKWQAEDAAFFAGIEPMAYFHRLQIRDFLQAVAAGRAPAVPVADGRRAVELFDGIYRSMKQNSPVPLSGNPPASEVERVVPPAPRGTARGSERE